MNSTVVEGNRRVATIKLLLIYETSEGIRSTFMAPTFAGSFERLATIPAIIYENRNEVLPYLGVRHIAGIKKWDSYAKARYVASMVRLVTLWT